MKRDITMPRCDVAHIILGGEGGGLLGIVHSECKACSLTSAQFIYLHIRTHTNAHRYADLVVEHLQFGYGVHNILHFLKEPQVNAC